MVQSVAKRYVRALFLSGNDESINSYYEYLKLLSEAFSYEKMKNILLSPTISKEKKYEFLVSLLDKCDDRFKNFIKILVENDRIYLIPNICDELRYQLSIKENRFKGKIISNADIAESSRKNIEEKLSQKFNANINLETIKSDYPGIKIEIEDLGVEISFSIERLKAQLTEYILKAI